MVRKLFPFVDPIVIKYLCLDSNRSKQKCFLLKKKKVQVGSSRTVTGRMYNMEYRQYCNNCGGSQAGLGRIWGSLPK